MENTKESPCPKPTDDPSDNNLNDRPPENGQPHQPERAGEEAEEEEAAIEAEAQQRAAAAAAADGAAPARARFTDLSQVDSDLALARTLQEQERAYMMLRMGVADMYEGSETGGSQYELEFEHDVEDHGSVEGSDYNDEDAFDAQEHELEMDPSAYNDDEAYAWALQEAEENDVAARMMAFSGLNGWLPNDGEEHGSNSQDTWQVVDPDDFSYEELLALGEAVGTENRGLSADKLASLPSVSYSSESTHDKDSDQCVICRLEYESGELLSVLPCKHKYHTECISKWLQINKVCPVCSAEVSTSGTREK